IIVPPRPSLAQICGPQGIGCRLSRDPRYRPWSSRKQRNRYHTLFPPFLSNHKTNSLRTESTLARKAYDDAEHSLKLTREEKQRAEEEYADLFDVEGFGREGEWKKLEGLCLEKNTGECVSFFFMFLPCLARQLFLWVVVMLAESGMRNGIDKRREFAGTHMKCVYSTKRGRS